LPKYEFTDRREAMARSSEVDKMSFAELTEMEAQIQRLKVEKHNTERVALRQKLTDEAKKQGYSIQELFGRGRKGKGTVAVKYRDPKNPSNTWTGRGRMPRWMAAATKGGKAKKDDFLL
jgi:DNA-binding protein H-NS